MTLRTVLLSLQALLAAAEPDDPQDAVVANQVRRQILKDFLRRCQHRNILYWCAFGNGLIGHVIDAVS